MDKILSILCLWAIVGYCVAGIGLLPTPKNRKDALFQTSILGPVFWVAIGIAGIKHLSNKKSTEK